MSFSSSRAFAVVLAFAAGAALFNPACSSDSERDEGPHRGGGAGNAGTSTGGIAGTSSSGAAGESAGDGGTAGQGGSGTSGGAGAGGEGAAAGAGAGGDGGTGGSHDDGVDITLTMYRGTVQANAALVAWQSSGIEWLKVEGSGGLYRFATLGDEHYRVAIVCQRSKAPDPGQVVSVTTISALTSEITSIVRTCPVAPDAPLPQFAVTVNVTGLSGAMTAKAYVGSTILNFSPTVTSASIMLTQGLQAVLVTRSTAGVPDRFLYSPDNDIRGPATLDFDPTAAGVTPTSGALSTTGAAATDLELAVDLYSTDGRLVNAFYAVNATSATYYALPSSLLTGSAVQFASAVNFDAATRRLRAIGRYGTGFTGPMTLTVPEALAAPTVSIGASNSVVVELSRRAGTQLYFNATSQIAGDDSRSTLDYVTTGFASASRVVLGNFDLDRLDAWDASYDYVNGTNVSWSLSAQASNRAVADVFANVRQTPSNALREDLDGFEIESAAISGTILP